jgi:hypothetical protein
MLIGSTPAHRILRLVRSYRGRPAGSVIAATPALAEHLVEAGWAVWATPADADRSSRLERAVAPAAAETR